VKVLCTLRAALADPHILGGLLDGPSWQHWRALLLATMGEPLDDAERGLFTAITGRATEPAERVDELWAVIGRRGGKTRAISVLAAYIAACVDYRGVLAPGEDGIVAVLAATIRQAEIALSYISAIFADKSRPLFYRMKKNETQEAVELSNHIVIEVRPASFRSIRGISAVAVIADEIAFWSATESVNPDSEILAAVRPALLTTSGPLIAISSPHAKRGELWTNYKRHYGPAGDSKILVANAPSQVMNPSLPEKEIRKAYERDSPRASAEYGARFRDDLESYVSIEAVNACVSDGTFERPKIYGTRYFGFTDPSGGSADSFTLAISHSEKGTAVLDAIRERKPPFSPEAVIAEYAELLKEYGITKVMGDRYAGEFPRELFRKHGISYETSEKTKSELYSEVLPLINSRKADLLDNQKLITQFCGLERRVGRSSKESIDHGPGGHDDLCNAVAGALFLAKAKQGMQIDQAFLDELAIASRMSRRQTLV
jgi:hypothetical protein